MRLSVGCKVGLSNLGQGINSDINIYAVVWLLSGVG
jgi:hypothetical protein